MPIESLDSTIAPATVVRLTAVGAFDPRHRAKSRAVTVKDAALIARLRAALAIDEASLDLRIALMTPGKVDLNFEHVLATVTVIGAHLRWPTWRYDGRLQDRDALRAELADCGWPVDSQVP